MRCAGFLQLFLIVAGVTGSGCKASLGVEGDLHVSCSTHADCPEGTVCLLDGDGSCVSESTPCIRADGDTYKPTVSSPTGLHAEAFNDRIELGWNAALDTAAVVERNRNGEGWLQVATAQTGALSYTDAEFLSLDALYTYRVHAVVGECVSLPSNEVAIYSFSKPPLALAAVTLGSSEIDLTWGDANTFEAGYMVERSDDDGATFTSVAAMLPADTSSYADEGLVPQSAYVYRVRAVSRGGDLSEPATVTGWTQATGLVRNTVLYAEDFESYAAGDEAPGWEDYGADFSSTPENTHDIGEWNLNKVWERFVPSVNHVTSYYVADGSTAWSNYSFSGRMLSASGAIGVSVLDDVPAVHDEYDLWARFVGVPFELAAPLLGARSDTRVEPTAYAWYRFEVQASTDADATRVRASVWPEVGPRPIAWQAVYEDSRAIRKIAGTIGVWSSGSDERLWDDLVVTQMASRLRIEDTQVAEGEQATLTVALDKANEEDVTVSWATLPASADGSDFSARSGSVTLPSGMMSTQVAVPTVADSDAEAPESFIVYLYDADHAPIEKPTARVLIVDDEVGGPLYAEPFTYPVGAVVPGWVDFEPGYSAAQNEELFKIAELFDEKVLWRGGVTYPVDSTDETSYLAVGGSDSWSSYELTGDMRFEDDYSGIGVRFFVQQPFAEHRAYDLRRENGSDFYVTGTGVTVPTGTTSTGVFAAMGLWYSFRLQVVDTGTATEIKARVWPRGDPEPASWQADCVDGSVSRLKAGPIGVWSKDTVDNYWDNLTVTPL